MSIVIIGGHERMTAQYEKICEESKDYERLHEICEREIKKHKAEKLPYRNII